MRIILGDELEKVSLLFREAAKEALRSTCKRRRCGAVVVDNNGEVIGRGFNSPPGTAHTYMIGWTQEEIAANQRFRCNCEKADYNSKVTDKTCCVHAEQRAIIDAVGFSGAMGEHYLSYPEKIFFASIDENGNTLPSGMPYCTICSKMALDEGIKEFFLFHGDKTVAYRTDEYNDLSYAYGTKDAADKMPWKASL